MGKGLRKRRKVNEERKAMVKKYDMLIEELLKEVDEYFFRHYGKQKLVMKLPNTSGEFWNALDDRIYRDRYPYQIRRVWYSKKRVKFIQIDPFFYDYY